MEGLGRALLARPVRPAEDAGYSEGTDASKRAEDLEADLTTLVGSGHLRTVLHHYLPVQLSS